MTHLLSRIRKNITTHEGLWLMVAVGILLRILYMAATPANVLSYDLDGHLDYIKYVMHLWTMPAGNMGWEMHQAPLYYYLAAVWVKVSVLLSPALPLQLALQILSLLLSLGTFALVAWMTTVIFPEKKQKTAAYLFLGICATLPGFVFFSARITNDALSTFLYVAGIAFLLRWWESGEERKWNVFCGLAALGILTKISGLSLLLIGIVCVAAKKGMSRHERRELGSLLLLIVILVTGWFFSMRVFEQLDRPSFRVFSTMGVSRGLLLPFHIVDFLSFSPVRVLEFPFNNPWYDQLQRRFFWDFLFKSAYVGEWIFFRYILQVWTLLLGGLCILALTAKGIWQQWRSHEKFFRPLLIILLTSLGSLLCYRLLHNSASNQDYRFIPQVVIPIAAFAASAADRLRGRLRAWVICGLAAYIASCAIFIIRLSLS